MTHEIEQNKAFYVNKPAWHGLGQTLANAPTVKEAWNLAYPHTLYKVDIEAVVGTQRIPLENSKVIIRGDGKELNTVSKDFELVQPAEILNYFKPIIDTGMIELESGGSLRDGKMMWVLGKVKNSDSEIVKNDIVKGYYLMATGFDGCLRITMQETITRVVCMNTLNVALNSYNTNQRFNHKLKHTKNVRDRMNNASSLLAKSLENFSTTTELYKHLANKKVTDTQIKAYIQQVFCTKDELKDEISTKKQTILDNVIELTHTQKDLEYVPAMRGTAWQAYNGITNYLTHEYGRSADSRINSLWFGQNAALGSKALELAALM